jgi:hypothetical protein
MGSEAGHHNVLRRTTMEPESKDPEKNDPIHESESVQHVASAYELLKALSAKLGSLEKHPELQEAILKLELALNALTINTGGMF